MLGGYAAPIAALDVVSSGFVAGTPVFAEIAAGDAPPALDAGVILGSRRHLGGAGAPALDELESLAAQADADTAGRRRVFSDALSRLTAGEPT